MREAVLHTILMDLQKAYDVLDQDSSLDILYGHGMVPRMLYLLRKYWYRLQMAKNAGG